MTHGRVIHGGVIEFNGTGSERRSRRDSSSREGRSGPQESSSVGIGLLNANTFIATGRTRIALVFFHVVSPSVGYGTSDPNG
jgi:hypothetical protein